MKNWQIFNLLILGFCLAAPAVCATPHGVITVYHRVGAEHFPDTSVTTSQFEAHLRYLHDHSFNVIGLSELVESIRKGGDLPDKSIALTFDDAYRSVYDHAFPILKHYGMPFTVFVATDAIDANLKAFMTWQQMREMAKHGASYANHSRDHDYLIRTRPDEALETWSQRVHDNIIHAHQRLEQELAHVLPYFAYPYGEYSLPLANIVTGLGLTGFGQQSGAVGIFSDFRWLPRFPFNEQYGAVADFSLKASSLPFPVIDASPADSITHQLKPRLEITLNDEETGTVACYSHRGEPLTITRNPKKPHQFATQSPTALPLGRSRYNCTARAANGRYYWYSHLWIRQHSPDKAPDQK